MKARTDCAACRKRIYKEAETEFLKQEYKIFEDVAYSMAYFVLCGLFFDMVRKGRTKKYINQLYDDMCMIFSLPDIFGRKITMTDVMTRLEKEYGIDWSKLELRLETEKEFIYATKKGERK